MTIQEQKARFEEERARRVYESATLTFHGAEGFDVYNCSAPFRWRGRDYLYGRVEKRAEWASSWSALFVRTGPDDYTRVPGHRLYQMEDPFVSVIHGQLTLGGTHVRKKNGRIDTYYDYFYRGDELDDLTYFTTGPEGMKDIRLVGLADGRIGVFSRPRNERVEAQYGSGSVIGFAAIEGLDGLTDAVILNAPPIEGLFGRGEWGGCNQPLLLANGHIGVIGHHSFSQPAEGGETLSVYMNTAFEFDPATFRATAPRVIGTRACYPAGPAKTPALVDCTFTSGLVMRKDGKADLYGGIGDVQQGRVTIDYPFSAPIRE